MWHVTASEAYLLLAAAVLQLALQEMPLVPALRCPDLRGHLHRESYEFHNLPIQGQAGRTSHQHRYSRLSWQIGTSIEASYLSQHLGGSPALNSMTASTCRPIR